MLTETLIAMLSLPVAIYDYLKGNKISEQEVEARRQVCNGCDFRNRTMDYCKKCGCFLEGELGKLKAPREKCPMGKWDVAV